MQVGGLVLAAGAGTRFGSPKALAPWSGSTLVAHAVSTLISGGCEPVLVVVGAGGVAVRAAVPAEATAVPASDWEQGMGASLRAGLTAATQTDADAVVVLLVDTPLVGSGAVSRLIGAGRTAAEPALIASYGGRAGHPVLLRRNIWSAVSRLAVGDTGARGWMRANQTQVRRINCDGTGSPEDADTSPQLQRLWTRRHG